MAYPQQLSPARYVEARVLIEKARDPDALTAAEWRERFSAPFRSPPPLQMSTGGPHPHVRPVILNGQRFASITAAARHSGYTPQYLNMLARNRTKASPKLQVRYA